MDRAEYPELAEQAPVAGRAEMAEMRRGLKPRHHYRKGGRSLLVTYHPAAKRRR